MNKSINEIASIAWFNQVPEDAWLSWRGPESPESDEIAIRTQAIIDKLEAEGIQAEPGISQIAKVGLQEIGESFQFDQEEDIYDAKYDAAWNGSWLIVAKHKCLDSDVAFPQWAHDFIESYSNGNWPWGIDEHGRMLIK